MNRDAIRQANKLLATIHHAAMATVNGDGTPQRMYRAELVQFWVNQSEKDANENVTNDFRAEITREDLLS